MAYANRWFSALAAAAVLCAGVGLQACNGDDDDDDDSSSDTSHAGSKSTPKAGASGKGTGGSGGKDSSAASDCVKDELKTNQDFLNACSELTCNPYDNSKLKKLGDKGELPEIP